MIEYLSPKYLPKLIEKLVSIRKERSNEIQEISDIFGDCEDIAKYYIEPNCQHGNPADEDDIASPISVPIFQVLNKILNRSTAERDGRNQLFVLADAGMGKTSLLVMIKYFNLCSFWPKGYECKLLKLGPDTLSNIRKTKNKSKTVLLLDALDEDSIAWESYERRVSEILRESINFKNIIVTCRTQFFPSGELDPFLRAGMISFFGFTCPIIYLSLFDNDQVKKYLSTSLKFSDRKIEQSKSLLTHMKSLKSRPLLLAHMQDLIVSKEKFDNAYDVYKALVQAWLNRETRKYDALETDKLWQACLLIAIEMTTQGEKTLTPLEIDKIKVRHPHINDIKRIDIAGRSLLNKNSFGHYRFSHYSIQEFLVAEAIIDGTVEESELYRCKLTGLTIQFLYDYYDSGHLNSENQLIKPGLNWNDSSISNEEYKNFNFVCARAFNAKLYKIEMSNTNLYTSNFANSNIKKVSFEKSNLSECNFQGSDISLSMFNGATISNTNFSKSIFDCVIFKDANVRKCNFSESVVKNCIFKGADLMYARFDNANLSGSDFRGCENLSWIQLEKALILDYVKMDIKLENHLRNEGVLKNHEGF